jgi:phosphatidylcholine synthase
VAVYLFAGGLPRPVNAAILLVLSVMVFVRIGYVYPSRTPVLRGLTTGLGLVWAAMVVAIIWMMPEVRPALLIVSLFFPIYYTVLSLVLHRRRRI